MRCCEQPAQRNVRRYAIGTGQRTDRKALAVEGRLLLSGWCLADAPAGVGQSCGGIGVLELGRNLSACLALWRARDQPIGGRCQSDGEDAPNRIPLVLAARRWQDDAADFATHVDPSANRALRARNFKFARVEMQLQSA